MTWHKTCNWVCMKWYVDIKLNRGMWALVLVLMVCGLAGAEPELKAIAQEKPARPHEVYRIVYETSWEGSPLAYSILPAEVDAIDWGTATLPVVNATVRDGVNVVSQTLEIIPNGPGEFQSPNVRIAYLNPEATAPTEKPAPGTDPSGSSASPSLRADPFTIVVRPARFPAWLFGGLGASLFLLVLGGWAVRRRRGRRIADREIGVPGAVDMTAVQDALHKARQRRLDGQFYEFYVELSRAAELVAKGSEGRDVAALIKAHAEEVGYKGLRPTDDQMDGDFGDVERALARLNENNGV